MRTVILLCAIALLVDLAEDGCLGKAEPVTPPSHGTIFHTCSPGKSSSAESPVLIPPARLPDILQGWQEQSIFAEIESPLIIIKCFLLSSSGGIPL
jgi:hypothetical protein